MGHPSHGDVPQGIRVCPEGQACSKDCLCSLANLISFVNPSDLKQATKICDAGVIKDTCIAREDLLESLKDVLFPAKEVTVVDFGADGSATTATKDEL